VSNQGRLPPEKLLGYPCEPAQSVNSNDIQRLESAELVVHKNFTSLREFFDGRLKQGILVVGGNTGNIPIGPKQHEQMLMYRQVHNYLASVYSFNEQVRLLVNMYRGDADATNDPIRKGAFVPEKATLYTQKLAFVRGLRIDFQHGDFSSVKFDPVQNSELGGGDNVYRVVFDKQAFRSGATESPDKYLQGASDEEMRYPTGYLYSFHRNHFVGFAEDTEEWFKQSCEDW
jgi:hypothetical protein